MMHMNRKFICASITVLGILQIVIGSTKANSCILNGSRTPDECVHRDVKDSQDCALYVYEKITNATLEGAALECYSSGGEYMYNNCFCKCANNWARDNNINGTFFTGLKAESSPKPGFKWVTGWNSSKDASGHDHLPCYQKRKENGTLKSGFLFVEIRNGSICAPETEEKIDKNKHPSVTIICRFKRDVPAETFPVTTTINAYLSNNGKNNIRDGLTVAGQTNNTEKSDSQNNEVSGVLHDMMSKKVDPKSKVLEERKEHKHYTMERILRSTNAMKSSIVVDTQLVQVKLESYDFHDNQSIVATASTVLFNNVYRKNELLPITKFYLPSETRLSMNTKVYYHTNLPCTDLDFYGGRNLSKVNVSSVSITLKMNSSKSKVDLPSNEKVMSVKLMCMFKEKVDDVWGKEGCTTQVVKGGVICHCNHTTAFASLLILTSMAIPEQVQILFLIFDGISAFFLILATFLLFIGRKELNRDRTPIQIQLTGSLALMHLSFIFGALVKSNNLHDAFCVAGTVVSHYFYLCSIFWMFNEGAMLYIKTIHTVFYPKPRKIQKFMSLFAWGAPFAIVVLTAGFAIPKNTYVSATMADPGLELTRKYKQCWLNESSGAMWSAIIPTFLVMIINGFIVARVSYVIYRLSRDSQQKLPEEKRRKSSVQFILSVKVTVKAVFVLICILGLPLILSFFGNIPEYGIVFVYIHGVCNGLRGIAVFLIYCVIHQESRTAIRRNCKNISVDVASGIIHVKTELTKL